MLNKDIEIKVDEYMKDLNTNEPAIREIITDSVIENNMVLNENEDNALVTLIFENMMEDAETKEVFNIRVFRTIQMIKREDTDIAVLRDLMFNHERREILIEFNSLDYELAHRFYKEENNKMFLEHIDFLIDKDIECNVFMYNY